VDEKANEGCYAATVVAQACSSTQGKKLPERWLEHLLGKHRQDWTRLLNEEAFAI